MKLSELPLRDFIAIEALPAVVSTCSGDTRNPTETREQVFAREAFDIADAMLARMGRHEHEHRELKLRADKAEASVAVLLNMGAAENFAPRVALLELWEALGADNQTAAMQRVTALVAKAYPPHD